uniref:Cilia and flagella associated protein 20 n=1 Tax=Nothobranchius furzeri TaxID=105023 RepID=A0A8C6LQD3_NOTFU
MFKNTFQSGFLSILYSIGSKPLQIWDKKVRNGHIKRVTDNDIHSYVLEIEGANVSTTYITCPADPKKTLGIKLPFLVMIIKNLKKYFTFEVQVLDDKNVRRRFRASNYQSTTRVKPFICTMPMRLDDGWNQIQFNLSDFTRRAYGTNYSETLRVQIHANCCIRRVYFSDRLYAEDELPAEFKLYLPVQNPKSKVSSHLRARCTWDNVMGSVRHLTSFCFYLFCSSNDSCRSRAVVKFSQINFNVVLLSLLVFISTRLVRSDSFYCT